MSRNAVLLVVGLLGVYALLGHRYMALWQSDAQLWTYAARVTPNHVIPRLNAEIVRRFQ